MNIHFDCTQCGRCCHNLKLPLSVDEAIAWAGRGHQVQLLCEAHATYEAPTTLRERYRHDRAFQGWSGSVPVRVSIILVAAFEGACPHLRSDMLCDNYEERPRVCRIYPAEITPDIDLLPDHKICPEDAWDPDQPLYQRGREVVDGATRALIDEHRAETLADVGTKRLAATRLGITTAAFGNEGYVVHTLEPHRLAEILTECRKPVAAKHDESEWVIVTNRQSTRAMLEGVGVASALADHATTYIGFFPNEP